MRQKKSLQPREIRVLRLDEKAIFDLIGGILEAISYEKFLLPHDESSICIEWQFDKERCEVILVAYSGTKELNKETANAYIKNLPGEALESLHTNTRGKYYHSIKKPLLFVDCPRLNKKNRYGNGQGNVLKYLFITWNGRIRQLRKHELRVIRLSEQAIHELIWEHFMSVGDDMMDIPKDDSFNEIFCMYVEEKLNELKLYVLNLNEVSLVDFEKVNAYCKENICFATDFISQDLTNRQYYTTMILSESFMKTS